MPPVLRGTDGKLLKGFPVEMGPIQAGVACGDVDGDGTIDIVAVDTVGNLAAFNGKGESLWDRMLSGSVSQAPTLADLDEDGMLEIVCATASGDVIAVRGKDGKGAPHPALSPYPRPGPLSLNTVNLDVRSAELPRAAGRPGDFARGGAAIP